jgi:hypothetical protein
MYPPALERASRLITPRIFPSSVEKEFFNGIDQSGRKAEPTWDRQPSHDLHLREADIFPSF